jgi:hypothetical protein
MNQGTQGYRLKKNTEGRKSRETVPLRCFLNEWRLMALIVQLMMSINDAHLLYTISFLKM